MSVDEMQFGFVGTFQVWDSKACDQVWKKLYMCSLDLEIAFDRVPRKVLEWAMRKKGIPEVLFRLVMSLYEGPKTSQSGFRVVRGV